MQLQKEFGFTFVRFYLLSKQLQYHEKVLSRLSSTSLWVRWIIYCSRCFHIRKGVGKSLWSGSKLEASTLWI